MILRVTFCIYWDTHYTDENDDDNNEVEDGDHFFIQQHT